MTLTAPEIDRLTPTRRPAGKPAGYHRWTNLLFAHWRVDAEALQPLLPESLTIDTFDGFAWVGLVPFHMSGVRPRGLPAVPGISTFHETNIRTYVHLDGKDPGVWFFSLDAASSLAVRVARWNWHLPYYRSQMTLARSDREIKYTGERLWPGDADARYSVTADIGDAIPAEGNGTPEGFAAPGTFTHFLAERYLMFAEDRGGRLLRGQVHHTPYPLRTASCSSLNQTLTTAAGIDIDGAPDNILFSDGVQVEVFPMRPVE